MTPAACLQPPQLRPHAPRPVAAAASRAASTSSLHCSRHQRSAPPSQDPPHPPKPPSHHGGGGGSGGGRGSDGDNDADSPGDSDHSRFHLPALYAAAAWADDYDYHARRRANEELERTAGAFFGQFLDTAFGDYAPDKPPPPRWGAHNVHTFMLGLASGYMLKLVTHANFWSVASAATIAHWLHSRRYVTFDKHALLRDVRRSVGLSGGGASAGGSGGSDLAQLFSRSGLQRASRELQRRADSDPPAAISLAAGLVLGFLRS
ncbi:hypothetical protein JKP88DRAFT_304138 [Tribonema minus]|uniref:Uncharacterized protein n=1 Tax=Tribonema minus TaxID=303371 RepID=A0A836CJI2_9STRA|nr:hypothetical protein JKP88DRAFT_304138 [Tribonema minus]